MSSKTIETWACPVCGEGPIVVDYGISPQFGYTEDSRCECEACGEVGEVRDFLVVEEVSDEQDH
jgi:hypothetical protein